MAMIWSIGWKNVWRNKARSLVVIVAVILGIFGGVMATGIMQGWIVQRIHDGIYNETSHVQIHHPDFINNEEIQYTIRGYDTVISILDTMPGIVAWSPRVQLFVMMQSDWAATGTMLYGVDPQQEKRVSEIHLNMVEGEYFEGDHRMPSMVISSKTAENLKLRNYQVTEEKLDSLSSMGYSHELIKKIEGIGKERFRAEKDFKKVMKNALNRKEYNENSSALVELFSFYRIRSKVTVTIQNKEGRIVNSTFRVRGIYKTNNSLFDGMSVFVEKDDLNAYTNLAENEIHEIAVMCTDNETGTHVAGMLSVLLPGNSILSWRELTPELAMYTDFSNIMGVIYVGIILFALAFGIINTMLMSVLERIKELGMLMAVGMNKKRVFLMIMLESVFLTLTGAVIGLALSAIIVEILSHTGINFGLWAEGFEAIGYAAIVYPVLTTGNYISIMMLVILTGIIASVWPARKALKLNPVEALRTD